MFVFFCVCVNFHSQHHDSRVQYNMLMLFSHPSRKSTRTNLFSYTFRAIAISASERETGIRGSIYSNYIDVVLLSQKFVVLCLRALLKIMRRNAMESWQNIEWTKLIEQPSRLFRKVLNTRGCLVFIYISSTALHIFFYSTLHFNKILYAYLLRIYSLHTAKNGI